jgi:hypothetical protein
VIIRCNYEEIQAVRAGTEAFLSQDAEGSCAVVAPPAVRDEVERLLPAVLGEVSVTTLQDQRALQRALEAVVECLRAEMASAVGQTHPAHEYAVAAYFDYAHALVVLQKVTDLGDEMEALIEVLTGRDPSSEIAASFQFPE